MNYYNEHDPKAAAWLRELIAAGLIPAGDVDERSITDVRATDLDGYTQCHFFAGIGGWPYALQLAGWPEDAEVWTGSCPCQPFSQPGKRLAENDERHLWPEFLRLIVKRRPSTVFGEQVSGSLGLGWLDGVFADMENLDYACGAGNLPAASAGATHERQRIFWVAHDTSKRIQRQGKAASPGELRPWGACSEADLLAIRTSPFVGGRCIPQPLLRSVDDGFSDGVAALHGYGNAIVPQVAAEFIQAFQEAV